MQRLPRLLTSPLSVQKKTGTSSRLVLLDAQLDKLVLFYEASFASNPHLKSQLGFFIAIDNARDNTKSSSLHYLEVETI